MPTANCAVVDDRFAPVESSGLTCRGAVRGSAKPGRPSRRTRMIGVDLMTRRTSDFIRVEGGRIIDVPEAEVRSRADVDRLGVTHKWCEYKRTQLTPPHYAPVVDFTNVRRNRGGLRRYCRNCERARSSVPDDANI